MEKKSFLVTDIFCVFLGLFGAHRFYTKHIVAAIAQLLTFGGCGIWTFVDLIMINLGKFKDHDGQDLEGFDQKIGTGVLLFILALGLIAIIL